MSGRIKYQGPGWPGRKDSISKINRVQRAGSMGQVFA
jgi:hypothetical protein